MLNFAKTIYDLIRDFFPTAFSYALEQLDFRLFSNVTDYDRPNYKTNRSCSSQETNRSINIVFIDSTGLNYIIITSERSERSSY